MAMIRGCFWVVLAAPLLGMLGQEHMQQATSQPDAGRDGVQLLTAELELARIEKGAVELEAKIAKQRADALKNMLNSVILTLFRQQEKGQNPSARDLLDKVAARYKKPKRSTDQQVQWALQNDFAHLYFRIGAYDESEVFGRLAVEGRETHLGEDHPDTLKSMGSLATALTAQGKHDESIVVRRQHVQRTERRLGPEHDDSIRALTLLCRSLFHSRRYEEAEPVLAVLCERQLAKGRRGRFAVAVYTDLRAQALRVLGRYSEAEQLLRELLALNTEEFGRDNGKTFEARCQLAWVLRLRGQTEEADRLDVEITELANFVEQINEPYWSKVYGGYLTFLRQYERAETCLVGNFERRKRFGLKRVEFMDDVQSVVDLYEAWGKPQEAARYRAMLMGPARHLDREATDAE